MVCFPVRVFHMDHPGNKWATPQMAPGCGAGGNLDKLGMQTSKSCLFLLFLLSLLISIFCLGAFSPAGFSGWEGDLGTCGFVCLEENCQVLVWLRESIPFSPGMCLLAWSFLQAIKSSDFKAEFNIKA